MQPYSPSRAELAELVAGRSDGELLEILRAVQARFRHIPASAMDTIAELLTVPRHRIAGLVDFYSFLSAEHTGDYHIVFSNNIIDQMAGKQALQDRLMARLGLSLGQTRADWRVRVDDASCTGMGDQGPAALINGLALTRLNAARIDRMAELIEARVPLDQWPSEWFAVDANVRQARFLLAAPIVPGTALAKLAQAGATAIWYALSASGLHGCGGAGFKTALKWNLCREAPGTERFVVCNADEGEPGTFKDRALLQAYPDLVLEGMTLCAAVVGAQQGFIYLRGEYEYLAASLQAAIDRRSAAGLLGHAIAGIADFCFTIRIRMGAGAYICGEESALIRSLEGTRGHPRIRPPFPVTHGYQQCPTVVNNVETFAQAAAIVATMDSQGVSPFSQLGTAHSRGTKLLSISGDCAAPGIYEFAYGTPVAEILAACQAQDTQAVQVAGAAGQTLVPSEFQRKLGFEDVATGGSFMIFNQQRDVLAMVQNFTRFFAHESCGFCTPCRIGTSLLNQLLDKIMEGHGGPADVVEIQDIAKVMKTASQCGLGATAPNPLLDTLKKFPQLYAARLKPDARLEPTFNLDAALADARRLAGRTESTQGLTP